MTPAETMAEIVSLRQAGRMDDAARHFTHDGILVLKPGQHTVGRPAIAKGYEAIRQAFPVFAITARLAIENGDVALHHSKWSAHGVDASGTAVVFEGISSDVLVRQSDGQWLVSIDNAWSGTGLG